jgi:hypothetical protein
MRSPFAADVATDFTPAWHRNRSAHEWRTAMLWTLFVVLLVLWALGLVSSYTLGGFIHILLVIALVVVLIRVIQGRRAI